MNPPSPPPRLLLGCALLFWGALTGHAALGLALGLLAEAPHWTRLRWDFTERSHIIALRLSSLLALALTVFFWLDTVPYMAGVRVLGLAPVVLLPLLFTQIHGTQPWMTPRVFALLGRRRVAVASPRYFHFGWVYFAAVLLAATPMWKTPDSPLHLPGLALLAGWALAASPRAGWRRVAVLLAVAFGIGLAGQWALDRASGWANRRWLRGGSQNPQPTDFQTAIGRLGEIKLSPAIVWRLNTEPGAAPPPLLRTRGYNRYRWGIWSNLVPPSGGVTKTASEDFNPLAPVELPGGKNGFQLRDITTGDLLALPPKPFVLRGSVDNGRPVPLPGNAAALFGFAVESFEQNSLGTVTIYPKETVAEGSVWWGDSASHEAPPWPKTDLWIDEGDLAAVSAAARDAGIGQAPTLDAKLLAITHFFSKFRYTLYNTIEAPSGGRPPGPGAISKFLTTTRAGHCEYFATAACLMLRQAGISCRYAIGYVVAENTPGNNEWVMRGTHAHAWTRVWDGRAWRDYDPTPAGWLAGETPRPTWWQDVLDAVQRAKEDIFLWRTRPENSGKVAAVLIIAGLPVAAFVFWRLWRSRRFSAIRRPRGKVGARPAVHTPLHDLENAAARLLPPRPAAQPYGEWLAGLEKHLADPAPLREAIALHQQARFDPQPAPPGQAVRLAAIVKSLRQSLRKK